MTSSLGGAFIGAQVPRGEAGLPGANGPDVADPAYLSAGLPACLSGGGGGGSASGVGGNGGNGGPGCGGGGGGAGVTGGTGGAGGPGIIYLRVLP